MLLPNDHIKFVNFQLPCEILAMNGHNNYVKINLTAIENPLLSKPKKIIDFVNQNRSSGDFLVLLRRL